MNKSFIMLLGILLNACCYAIPYSVAHRGCHINGVIPENCPAGVAMAKKYGFRAIECDVHYTKDSVMILMHDKTINRTMRNAKDYSEIKEPVEYSKLTYAELKANYVLASERPELRKPIPTFAEELKACKKYNIIPMMHTELFEAYQLAHKVLGDKWIAFNRDYESVKRAREISSCLVLWDPGTTPAPEVIEKLKMIGGKCGISSMKRDLLTADYCKAITDAGFEVQSSIFKTPYEVQSIVNGVTYVLSDFSLVQPFKKPSFTSEVSPFELKANEKKSFSWKNVEYGSVEIEISVKGNVEMIVCGRKYKFSSSHTIQRIGGWRFYKQNPLVEIVAKENSNIESLKIKYYKY